MVGQDAGSVEQDNGLVEHDARLVVQDAGLVEPKRGLGGTRRSCCGTRRQVFLCSRKACLLVEPYVFGFGETRRHVLLLNIKHEHMET